MKKPSLADIGAQILRKSGRGQVGPKRKESNSVCTECWFEKDNGHAPTCSREGFIKPGCNP